MTGLSESDQILRGFASGGVDYVVKPLRIPEVMARLATHVRNARVTRLAQEAVDVAGMGTVVLEAELSGHMLYIVNDDKPGFIGRLGSALGLSPFGNEQVLSFPMKGDMMGVDGIHTRHYSSEAVALSDCDLILLPFRKLAALGRGHIGLENMMYGVMSRELVREQAMIGMLGALSAEARVARFNQWAQAEVAKPGVRGIRLESLEGGRPEMQQTLERAEKFLNLVALLAALLCAVAVAIAARGFAQRHLDDCAMLRVLGLSQGTMARAYTLEFALVG
eukprot:gene20147-39782_t